jgi:hypothetical protein
MAKLTEAEVQTIKALLDAHGELPRTFQDRLFPPEEHVVTRGVAQTPHEPDGFAAALAQLPENEMDLAALARATETHLWRVPRLWVLAEALPVEFIHVDTLIWHFDTARWLGDDEPPTVRAIVEHARQILATDLAYPIILSADGRILDGMHRLAKAWITGAETIAAVRFRDDPEPDYRIARA